MSARKILACCCALALLGSACADEVTNPLETPRGTMALRVFVPTSQVASLDAAGASSSEATSSDGTWQTMWVAPCPGPGPVASVSAKVIGPEGGVIENGPFTLRINAGALPDSQRITLTRPPMDLLLLEATVGESNHYTFAAPIDFTVNVSKYCPALTTTWLAELESVWIDGPYGAVLVHSEQNPSSGKITFTTNHFSSYGIAW